MVVSRRIFDSVRASKGETPDYVVVLRIARACSVGVDGLIPSLIFWCYGRSFCREPLARM